MSDDTSSQKYNSSQIELGRHALSEETLSPLLFLIQFFKAIAMLAVFLFVVDGISFAHLNVRGRPMSSTEKFHRCVVAPVSP
jgi:hypothetical protein